MSNEARWIPPVGLPLEPEAPPQQRTPSFAEGFLAGAAYGAAGNAIEVGAGLVDYGAAQSIRDWYRDVEAAQPWAANLGEFLGGLVGGPFTQAARVVLGWIADGMVGEPPDPALRLLELNGLSVDQLQRAIRPRTGRDLFAAGADFTNDMIDARNVVEGNDPATIQFVALSPNRSIGPNDMQLFDRAIDAAYHGYAMPDQAALPPAYWFGGPDADLGSPAAQAFDLGDLGIMMLPASFYEARGQEPILPFFLPADPRAESYFFFPAGTDYQTAWDDVMDWRRARSLYPD